MNLYLRLVRVLFKLLFVQAQDLFAPARLRFRVWPTDCDLNMHMNNGRYLTFMDLGRVYLLAQARMLRPLWRRRWAPVLSAAEINYIRPLPPLQAFDLVTRLLTWDEKYFYIEHRFEVNGRLCAQATVKGLFLAGRERVASQRVVEMLGLTIDPPPAPDLIRHWNELGVLKRRHGDQSG